MSKTKMDPFATKPKKKKPKQYQNFLEAFKDIGSSVKKTITEDVIKGTAKSAVDVLTGHQTQTEPQKNQPEDFNFDEFLQLRENQVRQQERARFETIKREDTIIFSREQQQIKLQITTIQNQIKDLAKEQIGLMKEVDKAAFNAIVNPGVYHQNFFERLISLISLAKKKISESKSWLSLHNSRSAKQKGYWAGVKKGGSNFMLSGERTVATQTG